MLTFARLAAAFVASLLLQVSYFFIDGYWQMHAGYLLSCGGTDISSACASLTEYVFNSVLMINLFTFAMPTIVLAVLIFFVLRYFRN